MSEGGCGSSIDSAQTTTSFSGGVYDMYFVFPNAVPLVNCTATELSLDETGVRIVWDTIHTGGLGITTTTIEYSPLPSSDNNNMTSNNFTPVVNASVDVVGSVAILQALPDAGQTYVFRVTTANAEGDSVPSECPPIYLEIGKILLLL